MMLQTMRLPAHQHAQLFSRPLVVQMDANLHVDRSAQLEQSGDQLGQIAGEVLQIDEHVHQKKPADDALLDVFNVDAARAM